MIGVGAKRPPGTRPSHENPESAPLVVRLRPEPGYSSTIYYGSPPARPKSLRRQFGQKYDAKKVRNTKERTT
jgi:hypothetical protein